MQPSAPVVAWRVFRVHPGGELRGARHVTWVPGEAMHATHVVPKLMSRPREAPLLRLAWKAAPRWKRLVVSVPLLFAATAATAVVPAAGALFLSVLGGAVYSIRGRRTFLMGSLVAASTILVSVVVILTELSGALLLSSGPGHHGHNVVAFVSSVILTVLLCAQYAVAFNRRRPRHHCPSPPLRYFANMRPECGIHAYRTLDRAVRSLPIPAVEAYGGEPSIIARVQLWGRCYPYSDGWRAEYGRITALYDDDSGHVELPAVVYGCAVEKLPDDLRSRRVAREPERWVRSALAAEDRCRSWARHRRAALTRAQAPPKGQRP